MADNIHIHFLIRRVVRLGNQLGKTDNRIQRRTDFVAHIGQKRRFHPVGLLRLLFGGKQLLCPFHPGGNVMDQRQHLIHLEGHNPRLVIMPAFLRVQIILDFHQIARIQATADGAAIQVGNIRGKKHTPALAD